MATMSKVQDIILWIHTNKIKNILIKKERRQNKAENNEQYAVFCLDRLFVNRTMSHFVQNREQKERNQT